MPSKVLRREVAYVRQETRDWSGGLHTRRRLRTVYHGTRRTWIKVHGHHVSVTPEIVAGTPVTRHDRPVYNWKEKPEIPPIPKEDILDFVKSFMNTTDGRPSVISHLSVLERRQPRPLVD